MTRTSRDSEAFTCAADTNMLTLRSDWTRVVGTGEGYLKARASDDVAYNAFGDTVRVLYRSEATFTADQYVKIKVGGLTGGSGEYVICFLRGTGTGGSAKYVRVALRDLTPPRMYICTSNAGTDGTEYTNESVSWVNGDTFEAEVVGEDVSIYRNGGGTAVFSQSALATATNWGGGKPGFGVDTGGTLLTIDDFDAGDVGGGSSILPMIHYHNQLRK